MRFSLIPREEKFFDLFDEAGVTLTRTAGKFMELVTVFDRLSSRCDVLKKEETIFDEIVGRIIKALDLTFITPFDREDIHALATTLDDILDNMEETAHRFMIFRIDKPTPTAVSLARIIQDCCTHLDSAIRGLRHLRKPEQVQLHLREITRLENEADTLYREVDSALFAESPTDILGLIKWRELYGWLEATVDACKKVCMVISEIVVKGS